MIIRVNLIKEHADSSFSIEARSCLSIRSDFSCNSMPVESHAYVQPVRSQLDGSASSLAIGEQVLHQGQSSLSRKIPYTLSRAALWALNTLTIGMASPLVIPIDRAAQRNISADGQAQIQVFEDIIRNCLARYAWDQTNPDVMYSDNDHGALVRLSSVDLRISIINGVLQIACLPRAVSNYVTPQQSVFNLSSDELMLPNVIDIFVCYGSGQSHTFIYKKTPSVLTGINLDLIIRQDRVKYKMAQVLSILFQTLNSLMSINDVLSNQFRQHPDGLQERIIALIKCCRRWVATSSPIVEFLAPNGMIALMQKSQPIAALINRPNMFMQNEGLEGYLGLKDCSLPNASPTRILDAETRTIGSFVSLDMQAYCFALLGNSQSINAQSNPIIIHFQKESSRLSEEISALESRIKTIYT